MRERKFSLWSRINAFVYYTRTRTLQLQYRILSPTKFRSKKANRPVCIVNINIAGYLYQMLKNFPVRTVQLLEICVQPYPLPYLFNGRFRLYNTVNMFVQLRFTYWLQLYSVICTLWETVDTNYLNPAYHKYPFDTLDFWLCNLWIYSFNDSLSLLAFWLCVTYRIPLE